MTDDELFDALTGATMVTLVDERELDRRARHTARRIRREARREQVAGIHRWWVALVAGIALLLAGVGAATGGLLHREPAQHAGDGHAHDGKARSRGQFRTGTERRPNPSLPMRAGHNGGQDEQHHQNRHARGRGRGPEAKGNGVNE